MGTPRASAGQQAEEATIATGTVKFFSTYRGYGFIQPSDSSPDVFVHISVVQCAGRSHLVGGQKVSFDVVTKAGKSAAGNLKVNLILRAFSPNSGHWSSFTTPSCATWRA